MHPATAVFTSTTRSPSGTAPRWMVTRYSHGLNKSKVAAEELTLWAIIGQGKYGMSRKI